jgi:hypothetical protein
MLQRGSRVISIAEFHDGNLGGAGTDAVFGNIEGLQQPPMVKLFMSLRYEQSNTQDHFVIRELLKPKKIFTKTSPSFCQKSSFHFCQGEV